MSIFIKYKFNIKILFHFSNEQKHLKIVKPILDKKDKQIIKMYPLQHPKNLDSDNSKIFIHDKPLYYNTEMTGNEYISILKSCTF